METKPLIRLWETITIGLIVVTDSGVCYSNQTGGTACLHPVAEGVFISLEGEDTNISDAIFEYFAGGRYQGTGATAGIDEQDANHIDALLEKRYPMITVDREQLSNSHEAWIVVNIGKNPEKPKEFGSWESDMGLLFYGFENRKAILTWSNSD